MKKLIAVICMLFFAAVAYSQSPAPESDTLKNPVKQTDPEVKQLPPDLHYAENRRRINADELPAVIQKELKSLEPTGWEKSVVYHDKKEDTFIVQIRESGNEKTYKFNSKGEQLKPNDQEIED